MNEAIINSSLYRQDGSTRVSIDLVISAEGEVKIEGYDIGEAPEKFFGKADYEYGVKVCAADFENLLDALVSTFDEGIDIPDEFSEKIELVANLIKTHFSNAQADSKFGELCKVNGISTTSLIWS